MTLTTAYSLWLLPLCLIVGSFLSFLLYQKSSDEMPAFWKKLLFLFRAATLSFLLFFLLEPLLKFSTFEVEKPTIVILQDNSRSISLAGDSNYLKNEYRKQINQLKNELADIYNVEEYTFGRNIKLSSTVLFNEEVSNLSSAIKDISNTYNNRNLGAVVITSDGILNRGSSAEEEIQALKVPVYTIGLGDTLPKIDYSIQQVFTNKLAYLGNKFPLEIQVKGKKVSNLPSVLTLEKEGKILFSQPINPKGTDFFNSFPFLLQADKVGIQKYTAKIKPVGGEKNISNNKFDFFIEVISAKEKIALIYQAPHPDINAVKQILEENEQYEIQLIPIESLNAAKVKEFNLAFVFHLPGNQEDQQKLNALNSAQIPTLYIIGNKTALNLFNGQEIPLKITSIKGNPNECYPGINPLFTLFNLSPETKTALLNWPPLSCPNGKIELKSQSDIAFTQRIGSIETDAPMLVFSSGESKKQAILTGEGIWRWKMADFQKNGNNEAFKELFSKTAQYLSVKGDKKRFRIIHKNRAEVGEELILEAELYNESYEAINEPDVNLQLFYNGKNVNYSFSKNNQSYRLNLQGLEAGEYQYEASVKLNNKVLKENGRFVINAIQLEDADLEANHKLLNRLALTTHGNFVTAKMLLSLTEKIKQQKNIKELQFEKKELKELIDFKVLFFLLILIVSSEWAIRKYFGTY